MPNPVFQLAVRSLSKVVSGRAAETMLNASLRDLKLLPETVTPRDMQRVLAGPLERRLSQIMPGTAAFDHLRSLSRRIERMDMKDSTLFDQSARTVIWDQEEEDDETDLPAPPPRRAAPGSSEQTQDLYAPGAGAPGSRFDQDEPRAQPLGRREESVSNRRADVPDPQQSRMDPDGSPQSPELSAEEFGADDFSAEDFEFSDPEYGHLQAASKAYALSTPQGQDALLYELARHAGVQTVVLCNTAGQVLSVRAPQGAPQLGSVVAATALLFRQRELKLLSVDLGNATVCMRVVGEYCVALLARGNVNVGRLLTELQQIEVAA
ncbi:hypothetical protein DKM44_01775 [Deinococcus irradiatisoli]|uniref:Roadblock/LAMTOR2 domain-containing protein n=1 Tax=Deinococcus irradiatisoli TaxID=2202254 RepID=A0A2Z3JAU3_9DEIO|nr:roadblock/LC7 domain-containing protein [Deinococcus irradiatisoli]AWN22125.1 hypothetical protein DKM44_01775 [Deinococcus irradiatisoli]